jgi:hypothetical protein
LQILFYLANCCVFISKPEQLFFLGLFFFGKNACKNFGKNSHGIFGQKLPIKKMRGVLLAVQKASFLVIANVGMANHISCRDLIFRD